MADHANELYQEVSDACETVKGLAETPTEDSERINALAASFMERAEQVKGNEAGADTGWAILLAALLLDLADALERTKIRFDQAKMTNPLAGAQQRRWYDRERLEIVKALRKHVGAIATLASLDSTEDTPWA